MGTDRFYSKELTEKQKDSIQLIRQNFTQLYDYLDSEIPTSREKSLYTTKMEEACMWAIKAVSIEPVNFEEFVPGDDIRNMDEFNKTCEYVKDKLRGDK